MYCTLYSLCSHQYYSTLKYSTVYSLFAVHHKPRLSISDKRNPKYYLLQQKVLPAVFFVRNTKPDKRISREYNLMYLHVILYVYIENQSLTVTLNATHGIHFAMSSLHSSPVPSCDSWTRPGDVHRIIASPIFLPRWLMFFMVQHRTRLLYSRIKLLSLFCT
jgi:hypothetical protein